MNDAQLEDLKQFITARFSQQDEHLDLKFENFRIEIRGEMLSLRIELKSEIHALRTEMRDGFAGVADVIESNNHDIDNRLRRLERTAC